MGAEIFTAVLRFLKPGAALYFAVMIATGFILFMPDHWIVSLDLLSVAVIYRDWLAVGFIASASLAFVSTMTVIGPALLELGASAYADRRLWRKYKALSPVEKAVFVGPVWHHEGRFLGPRHHPALQSLIDKGFLHPQSAYDSHVAYMIPKAVQQMMMMHRDVVRNPEPWRTAEADEMIVLIGRANAWHRG